MTFFTHAGGAGKTSLVRDIGFQLSLWGKRVLLVDGDAQSNLTVWLGQGDVNDKETLATVVNNHELPVPRTVTFGEGTVDLIPANLRLALVENRIVTRPMGMLCLRPLLGEIRGRYDYILLDSPPSLGAIAGMLALAGDGLLVPVETSAKGIQALYSVVEVSCDYRETLSSLRLESGNQRFIKLLVPNRYDGRTRQDKQAKELLREAEHRLGRVGSPIPYRPAPYKEAIDKGVPLQLVADRDLLQVLERVTQEFVEVA